MTRMRNDENDKDEDKENDKDGQFFKQLKTAGSGLISCNGMGEDNGGHRTLTPSTGHTGYAGQYHLEPLVEDRTRAQNIPEDNFKYLLVHYTHNISQDNLFTSSHCIVQC